MAAPRANWKGYLRLSLVSCPVAVCPPPGRAESHYDRLNRNTGNRIKYLKASGTKKDAGASA